MADDKPEPIPRKSPKKSSGPSMREQIAARRRAEQAASADAAPAPAPKPAAKPAPKAAPKTAAKPRAASSKASTGDRPARPTRSGAGRAGASSTRRSRDAGEAGGRRGRREKPEKKSNRLKLIASLVVTFGAAGAYGFFSSDPTDPAPDTTEETVATNDTTKTGVGGTEPADADASNEDASATDAPAETSTDAPVSAPDAPAAEPKPKKKSGKLTDNSTDELKAMFGALTPFPRPQETSEAEWSELGKKADLLFVDAGRKSAAAERELSVDGKKEIYPLVINRYLDMDFESEEQVLGGKSAARVLTAVRGSKNDRFDIGWRTAGESEDGTFGEKELRQDLMIVINLHKSWSKVIADPAHWERIYIGEMYKEAEEIMKESAETKLDDLDDLDLDDLDLDDLDG